MIQDPSMATVLRAVAMGGEVKMTWATVTVVPSRSGVNHRMIHGRTSMILLHCLPQQVFDLCR